MNSECSDCGLNHSDQRSDYLSGLRVVATREFEAPLLGTVQLGTLGKVIAHCDDGRAVVDFGDMGIHTFHQPASYLAKAS